MKTRTKRLFEDNRFGWCQQNLLARLVIFSALLYFSQSLEAQGSAALSDNILLDSQHLGYPIQYRVYQPPVEPPPGGFRTIYLTDGDWFIKELYFVRALEKMIKDAQIKPVVAVFVDSREPGRPSNNRRSQEYGCNPKFGEFFTKELVSTIDKAYPVSTQAKDRVIAGISFGGLNAACFGLFYHQTFQGIGMLSPALFPIPQIYDSYEQAVKLPLYFFLTTGTIDDNEMATRKFRNLLQAKGYPVEYIRQRGGRHKFSDWRPLLDDLLLHFYAVEKVPAEADAAS